MRGRDGNDRKKSGRECNSKNNGKGNSKNNGKGKSNNRQRH